MVLHILNVSLAQSWFSTQNFNSFHNAHVGGTGFQRGTGWLDSIFYGSQEKTLGCLGYKREGMLLSCLQHLVQYFTPGRPQMTIHQYHTEISLDGNTKSDRNQTYNYHKHPPIFNILFFYHLLELGTGTGSLPWVGQSGQYKKKKKKKKNL